MKLTLYNTADAPNVLNKTLTVVSEHDITLKSTTDISAPVIQINDTRTNLDSIANYAYIQEFDRYYFITGMTTMSKQIWALSLAVDVLESFKMDIMGSTAEIIRHIQPGDYLDIAPSHEVRKEVEIIESNKGFLNQETILFSTIGQNID